jgi:hypothetical protein
MTVRDGTAYTIAADPTVEIMAAERDPMRVRETKLGLPGPASFPAASVTALVIDVTARA